ncbi:MFS general substrate transporter [Epithele typhae]|uniref:MFS general substrate transporter n=1 Tax=Epithele typhae TaxID=378194 RepID=UPI002008B588|nr:MFS general substrate transporter [Epithele typhae]KAH9919185.1 MFS general substrate transporter [Epithele typhae]
MDASVTSPDATVEEVSRDLASRPEEAPGPKVDFGFLPVPTAVRYDPAHPIHFGLGMNILFGLASTCSAANLYYCVPILIQLADAFGVTEGEVSQVPTLMQAGYAVGLLLLAPLGDLVRRRPLILLLTFLAASFTIGLAVTSSLVAFEVLNFFVGFCTIVPQVLIPLAVDLAPPERRASALSIVISGLLLGVLISRLLAGIVAQFVTWRVVYYIAVGIQYIIFALLYWYLPDYPAKNPDTTYFGILYSMARYAVTEPVLVQGVLMTIPSSAVFTNWWVTLTFILNGAPYHYSTLVIGLFGIIGIVGVALAPLIGRLIDGLVPYSATLLALFGLLATFAIQAAAAGTSVAAVVIVAIGIDVFRQMQQTSIAVNVLGLDPRARSRLNAVLILALFVGQVMGTSVGSEVFTRLGWRANAALNLGWAGLSLVVLLVRGPHVPRYTWVGWEGGWELRKSKLVAGEGEMGAPEDVTAVTTQVHDGEKDEARAGEKALPPAV